MVYIGGEEGSVTEIKFEKCKDGVTLYREVSVQSKNVEEDHQPPPLSPDSKSKEMSALSEGTTMCRVWVSGSVSALLLLSQ